MALPLIAAAGVVVGAAGITLAAATAPGFMLFLVEESLQAVGLSTYLLVQAKQWKGVEKNLETYDEIVRSYRIAINIVGAVYKLDPTGLLFGVVVFPHVQYLKASMQFSASTKSLIKLHLGNRNESYKQNLEQLQQGFDARHALVAQNKSAALNQIKFNLDKKKRELVEDYNDKAQPFLDDRNDALLEVDKKISSAIIPFRLENTQFKSELRAKMVTGELSREEFLAQASEADRVFVGQVTGIKQEFNQEKDAIRLNFSTTTREFAEKRTRKLRKLQETYNDTWIAIQVQEKSSKRELFAEYNIQKMQLDDIHFPVTGEEAAEPGVEPGPPPEAVQPEGLEETEKFAKVTELAVIDLSKKGHEDAITSPAAASVAIVRAAINANKTARAAAREIIINAPAVINVVKNAVVAAAQKVSSVISSVKNAAARTISKIFRKQGKK